MKDEQRIKALEEEIKVLKNEIKTVLLDLREQYLSVQNPFNYGMAQNTGSEFTVNQAKEQETEQPKAEEEHTEVEVEPAISTAPSGMKTAGVHKHIELPAPPPTGDTARLWQGTELHDEEEEFDRELPRREIESSQNKRRREHDFFHGDSKVDLVVIAGLTQWIDQATAKLGKERTEILIEMFFAMGRLPEKLKDTLVRMIHVSHHESQGQSITASDYLALLAQLENLLADPKQQDKALLSILSMMKDCKDG